MNLWQAFLCLQLLKTTFEDGKLYFALNRKERHNKETKVGKDMFVKQATEVIKKVVNML